ncbi:MAG: diheme cytochrome c [Pseudomonadota bacterium]
MSGKGIWQGIGGVLVSAWVGGVSAGSLNEVLPMPESPLYVQECGSCHTAYAPTYLPAKSWRKLMQELDRHFGEDVSLAPASRELLQGQLEALAGDGPRGVPGIAERNARVPAAQVPQRVTEMPFFGFMHDEVPRSVWGRKLIGSKANCVACHGRADEGRYFEREIRIPK